MVDYLVASMVVYSVEKLVFLLAVAMADYWVHKLVESMVEYLAEKMAVLKV